MLRSLQPRSAGSFRGLALFRCKPAQFRFYSEGPKDDTSDFKSAKQAAASKPRWGSATRDYHREMTGNIRAPRNQGGVDRDFDPSDPTSLYAHQKQSAGDQSYRTDRGTREKMSEAARAMNTRRPITAGELAYRKKRDKDSGDVDLEHMMKESPEDEFDQESRRLEEKARDLESDFEDVDLDGLDLGVDQEDHQAMRREREDKKREEVKQAVKLQQKLVSDRFLEDGDEGILDRQTQGMIKPTGTMFFDNDKTKEDMSPRVKALLQRRIQDERKFILDLNLAVKTQKILGKEGQGNTPEEVVGRGFEDMSLRQKIRDARMATEAEFQLIGYLTTMEDAQSKRLRDERKEAYKLDKHKEKIKAKYGEKIKLRREKNLAARQAMRQEHATNPDWFFYNEIKWWVHKKHLHNLQVRGSIQALLKNPSYTDKQKRDALDLMIKYIEGAENKPQEWYDNKWQYYEGLAKPNPQRTSPDYGRDPTFVFPTSYESMIEAVEAEMTYEERVARFAAPEQEPKFSKFEY